MYIDKRRIQALLKHWLITFYEGKDFRCSGTNCGSLKGQGPSEIQETVWNTPAEPRHERLENA